MSSPSALPPTPPPPLPPPPPSSSPPSDSTPKKKPLVPTPQELVSHYESQGMETSQATMKVIEDLQNVLVRVVTSGRGKKDKFIVESSRKLDNINARLAILELKVDSKPGYGQALAIGVAAGGIVNGIGSAVPHVFGAIREMWSAVRSSTKA